MTSTTLKAKASSFISRARELAREYLPAQTPSHQDIDPLQRHWDEQIHRAMRQNPIPATPEIVAGAYKSQHPKKNDDVFRRVQAMNEPEIA